MIYKLSIDYVFLKLWVPNRKMLRRLTISSSDWKGCFLPWYIIIKTFLKLKKRKLIITWSDSVPSSCVRAVWICLKVVFVIIVGANVVDSHEEGRRLFGNRSNDGRTVGADSTVFEPMPEFFHVFEGIDFDLVLTVSGTLQHQELSKKLVRVRDFIFFDVAFSQFFYGCGSNPWNRTQIRIGRSVSPIFHGVIGHPRFFWIISVSLTITINFVRTTVNV